MFERLPRGITGFCDSRDGLQFVDSKSFKSACFAAAREVKASVLSVEMNPIYLSYYRALLETRHREVTVLCNCIYPYLGFVAAEPSEAGHFSFIRDNELSHAFAKVTEFVPLEKEWLESDVTPTIISYLDRAELHQMRYWKPKRVGDIIFNYWD